MMAGSSKTYRASGMIALAAMAGVVGMAGLRAVAQQSSANAAPDIVVTGRSEFKIFAVSNEASRSHLDFAAWTDFLTKLVSFTGGRSNVAYRLVREGGAEFLDGYVGELQGIRPEALSRQEQLAFWLNLHNAQAVRLTTANYPVRAGDALVNGAAWNAPALTVSGVSFSLAELRTVILPANFKDPRIISALALPAKGGPPLQQTAFDGRDINAQLDAAAAQYINLNGTVSVKGDVAFVAPVFTENRALYGGKDADLLAHLRKFASPKLAAKLAAATQVQPGGFNWALNDYVPRADNAQNRGLDRPGSFDGPGAQSGS